MIGIPSSAKFGPNDKSKHRRNTHSLRPSSARASETKKMSFVNASTDEMDYYECDDDSKGVDMPGTPTGVDSDCSDSDSLSSDSSEDDFLHGVTQRDISVFRGHISNGYMPKETNISFDGLLNEYYFDETHQR